MRLLRLLSLLLALLAALTACRPAKLQLHVFIWPDYLDPQAVAAFEKAFDCRVTLDYYEDVPQMMAKLAAGGDSTYDIVVPGHFTLPALIHQGLLAPLRHENLPNLAHIDPRFRNPAFDPGNRYGAPYLWGTTGIYARKPKDQPLEETWALILDPARQPGPFLLLEDGRLQIGAALHFRGHRINTTDPGELLEARDLLLAAKQRSLGFAGSFSAKNRVLAREAALAVTYNNDALRGVAEDPDTYYFVPREGGGLWLDTLSIPARAPHRDLAESFINFMLDPRVGADTASFTRTATANRSALEFIPPADRQNPAIYPTPEIMARLEYCHDLGTTNRLFDELWTLIKTK